MRHVEFEGARLTIYLGVLDVLGSKKPQWNRIFEVAREEGLAGVSAFEGIRGAGRSGEVSYSHLADVLTNLPVKIEIVDRKERIEAFLPVVERYLGDALMTVEPVRYFATLEHGFRPLDDESGGGMLSG
jgi:uncharacterized protein